MKKFRSNGKLLLTAEYAVLDGAMALAIPTKYGQSLKVKTGDHKGIIWKSQDENDETWFEAHFELHKEKLQLNQEFSDKNQQGISSRLQEILWKAHQLNPQVLHENEGLEITTKLDFNQNWGLGSSSTLINNVAHWFKIDPYILLDQTFGGSGYDIAVAQHHNPITYQLTGRGRSVLQANFDPVFKKQLFFVYLNRKQNSRQAISHYRNQPQKDLEILVEKVSAITQEVIACTEIQQFELLMLIHENLISKTINIPKIKSQLFVDYPGTIKSLGGWGGDFILATGAQEEQDYFRKKGFTTIIPFTQMAL